MDDLELLGWTKLGARSYRHHCGAKVTKRGNSWAARTVDGVTTAAHETAYQAVAFLEQRDGLFWSYGKLESFGDYGGISLITGHVNKDHKDKVFVCFLSCNDEFPTTLRAVLKKYLLGKVKCVKCLLPMTELKMHVLREFDGYDCRAWREDSILIRRQSNLNKYFICGCGHPVWRFDGDYLFALQRAISLKTSWECRRQNIVVAGGKHRSSDIQEILRLQRNRCVYCNKLFTDKLRPTKDHLLAVSRGGTNWAANILMACKPCNSSRCNIPFRTYCKLLSPKQNQRILEHLSRRILALNIGNLTSKELGLFSLGLAHHEPRNRRYQTIQSLSAVKRRHSAINQLLPKTCSLILKRASIGLTTNSDKGSVLASHRGLSLRPSPPGPSPA